MTSKPTSMPRQRQRTADDNLVKALSHPMRWQILHMINEGTSTPAGIARRLGVRTENVSYHVRVLSELGIIELVGTTPVRGALEHHYRATSRAFVTDADAAAMPPEVRRDALQTLLRTSIDHLVRVGASERPYERSDAHFSLTKLLLDQEGYDEVVQLLNATLERTLEIQAESLARMAGEEADEIRTEVAVLHYPAISDAE